MFWGFWLLFKHNIFVFHFWKLINSVFHLFIILLAPEKFLKISNSPKISYNNIQYSRLPSLVIAEVFQGFNKSLSNNKCLQLLLHIFLRKKWINFRHIDIKINTFVVKMQDQNKLWTWSCKVLLKMYKHVLNKFCTNCMWCKKSKIKYFS